MELLGWNYWIVATGLELLERSYSVRITKLGLLGWNEWIRITGLKLLGRNYWIGIIRLELLDGATGLELLDWTY